MSTSTNSVIDQPIFDNNDTFNARLKCNALNTTIFFPSMPESFDVERSNDFDTRKSPLFPDGLIAIYKGSDPITIPFSFSVSAHDPRCAHGPVTLMDAAKALHAMALPLIPTEAITSLGAATQLGASSSDQAVTAGSKSGTANLGGADVTGISASSSSAASSLFYQPPAVQLTVFESQADGASFVDAGTGINMSGFLKSVKVSPRGPWLRLEGFTGRLPSSMDYSFNFVFFPSYVETFGLGANGQSNYVPQTSTAITVAQYFFGTAAVVKAGSSTLTGDVPNSNTGGIPLSTGGTTIQPVPGSFSVDGNLPQN